MDIIKNTDTIDVTCTHCQSVLRITFQDIKDDIQNGTHIICAVCDKPTVASPIPEHWRPKIKWAD